MKSSRSGTKPRSPVSPERYARASRLGSPLQPRNLRPTGPSPRRIARDGEFVDAIERAIRLAREFKPELTVICTGTLEPASIEAIRAASGQDLNPLQEALVFAEVEVHGYFRGRPRIRSPAVSRPSRTARRPRTSRPPQGS